jgi:hypothetical protein
MDIKEITDKYMKGRGAQGSELMKGEEITFQAMRHMTGNQRQGGKCVSRGNSGLEALGGGSFEEVVRPSLGNCSINTQAVDALSIFHP